MSFEGVGEGEVGEIGRVGEVGEGGSELFECPVVSVVNQMN
jgi:hypothetical protein